MGCTACASGRRGREATRSRRPGCEAATGGWPDAPGKSKGSGVVGVQWLGLFLANPGSQLSEEKAALSPPPRLSLNNCR